MIFSFLKTSIKIRHLFNQPYLKFNDNLKYYTRMSKSKTTNAEKMELFHFNQTNSLWHSCYNNGTIKQDCKINSDDKNTQITFNYVSIPRCANMYKFKWCHKVT